MGYSIEVSFNISQTSNVSEIQKEIKILANYCGCSLFYEDYEFESNMPYPRKHCVITVSFDNSNICNLLFFIKNILSKKYMYIETIYDDNTKQLLYASKYYIAQKMD